jgi:hypothetical protein
VGGIGSPAVGEPVGDGDAVLGVGDAAEVAQGLPVARP